MTLLIILILAMLWVAGVMGLSKEFGWSSRTEWLLVLVGALLIGFFV